MVRNLISYSLYTLRMTASRPGFTAVVACLLPAWRATRVDPVTILQAE